MTTRFTGGESVALSTHMTVVQDRPTSFPDGWTGGAVEIAGNETEELWNLSVQAICATVS